MTLSGEKLMDIVTRAFNAGEIESQITEQESKFAFQQILRYKNKSIQFDAESALQCPVCTYEYDKTTLKDRIANKIKELEAPRNSDDSDQYHERQIIIKSLKELEKSSVKHYPNLRLLSQTPTGYNFGAFVNIEENAEKGYDFFISKSEDTKDWCECMGFVHGKLCYHIKEARKRFEASGR